MRDSGPSEAAFGGSDSREGGWPPVKERPPLADRRVRPGAGSELFHGTK